MSGNSKSFKIPYAIDSAGTMVSPLQGQRTGTYFCPCCSEQIILRCGNVKAPHFAHMQSACCSEETVLHKTAKWLIKYTVDYWIHHAGRPPQLQKKCSICKETHLVNVPMVDASKLEYRLPGGYIADVVLLVDNIPKLAIEVKMTHAVDAKKHTDMPIPFIELEAKDILDNPYIWKSCRERLKPTSCLSCKQSYTTFKSTTAAIARKTKVMLPSTNYAYYIDTCKYCHSNILLFDWSTRDSFDLTLQKPPDPAPKSIRRQRIVSTDEERWYNTCPHCNSPQSDIRYYQKVHHPESHYCHIQRMIAYFEPDKFWPISGNTNTAKGIVSHFRKSKYRKCQQEMAKQDVYLQELEQIKRLPTLEERTRAYEHLQSDKDRR